MKFDKDRFWSLVQGIISIVVILMVLLFAIRVFYAILTGDTKLFG